MVLTNMNNLSCYSVPPNILCLFDGTTTTIITKATDLPIQFPSGDVTLMIFYVTLLDSDCRIISDITGSPDTIR